MEIFNVFMVLFSGDILTTCTFFSGLFFGWTIGSHYTGATLGMAYGAGIVKSSRISCLLVAFFSFSQLACFSVVGAGLAMGVAVYWQTTIVLLFATWIGTPLISSILGYIFTKTADRIFVNISQGTKTVLGYALLAACCYAAYTLGANNTGNAVGVFYGLGLTTPMKAGFIGGIVMGIGAMTWDKPILEKVGKGIIRLDVTTGLSAKLTQSLTAHTAAMLGYPTSMNQALIGGVAGAGGARGLQTLNKKALAEIVFSWFFKPALAGVVSFALYKILSAIFKIH